jgi:peptidyl-prolyl cis-trans isomerase D
MAVIGTIRARSGLLILLIGASLFGFLIMDFTNSQFSILKGKKDSVGVVNGEKISINDYTKKYEDNIKNMEEQQMRGQPPMGDMQRNYLRTQTWNEMVNEIIFNNIYTKLGINVTPEEMNELATSPANASPDIRRQFTDPQTRQFDPGQVRLFLAHLDDPREGVEPGTLRKQWLKFEAAMKQSQFQNKYNNLISKGLYVPTWMAEMAYNDQSRLVDFKYVQLPFSEVPPADVKVTDEDLKKYVDEHASRYKQDDETRKIDYVTFDIAPSAADSINTLKYLLSKRDDFAKGEKPSDDSIFVKLFSERQFDVVFYDKSKLMNSPVKDSLFEVKVGTVLGPYLDGDTFKLAKVSAKKMISDSVRVREIKFNFATVPNQAAADEKLRLLDSVYKAIDSLKGDFAAFASTFSDDETTKGKGGDIGWIKEGEKDKSYNDLIFYQGEKGKAYVINSYQTDRSFRIIQVTADHPSKQAVQVAYFTKEIIPSPETEKNIYGIATSFAADNQSEAKFKGASEKLHAKTAGQLKKDAFDVPGLMGSARDLVKWAFNAKKGDVSPVFTVEKVHVVALLEDIRPKGVPDFEALKNEVKPEVEKEKRFEILSKKITDAKANNIDELASKLGKPATEANKASFARPAAAGIFEPAVVATALNLPAGKLSAPIKGNTGVFVVQTLAVQDPPKTTDYSMYGMMMKQQLQAKSRQSQDVEKKLAKIEDNRFDFF